MHESFVDEDDEEEDPGTYKYFLVLDKYKEPPVKRRRSSQSITARFLGVKEAAKNARTPVGWWGNLFSDELLIVKYRIR